MISISMEKLNATNMARDTQMRQPKNLIYKAHPGDLKTEKSTFVSSTMLKNRQFGTTSNNKFWIKSPMFQHKTVQMLRHFLAWIN